MIKRELNIRIVPMQENANDLAYWQSKTADERFAAAESLRRHFYIISGYDEIPKIQKIITIRKRNANPQ
jgi:hypothetical protein